MKKTLLLFLLVTCPAWGFAPGPALTEVESAIERSAEYLSRQVRENGMFEYRINLNPKVEVRPKYNILRHAGAVYSMGMYHRLYASSETRSAMERAARFLRETSIGPVAGEPEMLAVWSRPEINHSGKPLQAKLGGTGLGLVALMSLEAVRPGFTAMDDLRALGRFLAFMQRADGSFFSKYIPSEGGRWDEWHSLFYPGEAALGLIMLYEKDRSASWLAAASKALAFLARSRQGEPDIPTDHWALLATARLLSIGTGELPVSRELLIRHAAQICEAILHGQIDDPQRPEYAGGFVPDGRITPTSTRLEGLLAALSFLPEHDDLRRRTEAAVDRGTAFLLRAQVTEGEFAGAFPGAIKRIEGVDLRTDEFNRRATEVRIDYVQHALSALIQYRRLRFCAD